MQTPRKRNVILGIIITVVIIVVFGVTLYMIEKHGLHDVQFGDTGDWQGENDGILLTLNDKDYISSDRVHTYLFAGTDAGGQDKGEGHDGALADFIAVLITDDTTKKYAFYEIDRNSMVNVPMMDEGGDISDFAYEQICTAHWYGPDEDARNNNLCLAATEFFGGLQIDDYFVINMENIGYVNDAIGGVTVTIDSDMTRVDPAFSKGATVHLEGAQAEKYLRARSDVGGGTNAERMDRQTQYMQNAFTMVLDQLREKPEYINDLYNELESLVESGSGEKSISQAAAEVVEYESEGILRFSGKTKVNDTIGEGILHEEFYADPGSVIENLRRVIVLGEDTEDEEDVDEDY